MNRIELITFIVIYFIAGLLFMLLTFYFLNKHRVKKRKIYEEYFPKLIISLEENKLKEAVEFLKIIMWNSNMIKHRYIEVQNLMNGLDENDPEYKELVLIINEVYEKRGWNA